MSWEWFGRVRRAWALVLLALLPGLAAAAEPALPPAHELPLGFAEALGLCAASPLVTGVAQASVAKGRMEAGLSRLTLNPQLAVQAGYRRASAAEQGLDIQGAVSQGFHLSPFFAERQRSLRIERSALGAEAAALLFGLRLRVARIWLDLWGAQNALAEAQKEAELAVALLALVEKSAQATALTSLDVAEARAYLAEAVLTGLSIEGEVHDQGLLLWRELGRPVSQPARAVGEPPSGQLPAWFGTASAEESLLGQVAQLPAVTQLRLLAEAEGGREREVHAQRGSLLYIGALGLHEPATPFALLGTLGFTPALFDRGERERAELLARQARLTGEAGQAAGAARAELAMVFHEVEHSQEVWAQLSQKALPASAEALRLRERLLVAGDETVIEVVRSRRNVAVLRGRVARAWASHLAAVARLELYLQELASAGGVK
jgi:outer membrane protein TolC